MEKAKAEARLAKLREGGISVDEYIDAFVYTAEQVKISQVDGVLAIASHPAGPGSILNLPSFFSRKYSQ